MATADGYVLPKPGIPKTLGILSVIFAVILILFGICGLAFTVLFPTIAQVGDTMVKEGQKKIEADQKARAAALDERDKAAKTDEEKASIKAERDALGGIPSPPKIDMASSNEMLTNPTFLGFTYLNSLTGLILQVVLLIAGVGLIRLTPWGRSLGIYWAGLQIAQLVILTAVSYFYVQPTLKPINDKNLAKAEAEEKAGGAPNPAMAGMKVAKMMEGLQGVFAIGYIVVGSIFPTIMLILLNNPGARAACRAAKPPDAGPAEY